MNPTGPTDTERADLINATICGDEARRCGLPPVPPFPTTDAIEAAFAYGWQYGPAPAPKTYGILAERLRHVLEAGASLQLCGDGFYHLTGPGQIDARGIDLERAITMHLRLLVFVHAQNLAPAETEQRGRSHA